MSLSRRVRHHGATRSISPPPSGSATGPSSTRSPRSRRTDREARKHADSKVIGFRARRGAGARRAMHRAATFFLGERHWKTERRVDRRQQRRRTFPRRRQFPADDRGPSGPETCNTYNMLRLSEALFEPVRRRGTPSITSARCSTTSSAPNTPTAAVSSTSRRCGRGTTAFTRGRGVLLVLLGTGLRESIAKYGRSSTPDPKDRCSSTCSLLRN
jgi:hypothetical protein